MGSEKCKGKRKVRKRMVKECTVTGNGGNCPPQHFTTRWRDSYEMGFSTLHSVKVE